MLMFDFLSLINIISILRIHSVYSIFYPYILPLFLCPISPPGGSEWIISIGDYVNNSFTALGSSDPREVRLEL